MIRKIKIVSFVSSLLLFISVLGSSRVYSQDSILLLDLTDHYFKINQHSADSLLVSLNSLGYEVVKKDQVPSVISINDYEAVLCCTGMFPANGILSKTDIQALTNYLTAGGKLYLEGGDVWYYDPLLYHTGKIETIFGISSSYDGNYLGDVEQVSGVPGNFTDGIFFNYEGFVNYTDFLYLDWENNPNAFNIWDNEIVYSDASTPFQFPAGVACDVSGGYKTIGCCFEFSGIPHDLKDEVLSKYLSFFLPANAKKSKDVIAKAHTPQLKSIHSSNKSPSEKAQSHGYPKIFNEYTGVLPTDERIDSLAYWDMVILNTWNLISRPDAFGPDGKISQRNPNSLEFMYFSSADYDPYSRAKLDCGFHIIMEDDWIVKDVNGEAFKFFQLPNNNWTNAINLSTQVNASLPYYLNKHILKTGLIDGIYYDWITEGISWVNYLEQNPSDYIDIDNDGLADSDQKIDQMWIQGTKDLLTNSREIFLDSCFIIGNGGSYFDDTFKGYLQGRMNEGLYSALDWLDWHTIIRGHYLMHKDAPDPVLSMIQFTGEQSNYQRMRFGLTTALLMGAYYQYTSQGDYQATWWYDEYAINLETLEAERTIENKAYLGAPLSQPYNAKDAQVILLDLLEANDTASQNMLWRRDFENGIVFCNPSLQPISLTYNEAIGSGNTDDVYRINGSQDVIVNNGQKVETGFTINGQDGLILLFDYKGTTGVREDMSSNQPKKSQIERIFPNPSSKITTVNYCLSSTTNVTLEIYNLNGELVYKLDKGVQTPGQYLMQWDASEAPAGVYLIELEINENKLSRKCLIIK